MYLLDPSVVSELRRPKPHGAVVAWLRGLDDADLHAAVSLGEIHAGMEITREQDPAKAAEIEDGLIAATPLVHGLTVAVKEFRPFGVPVLDPFAAG